MGFWGIAGPILATVGSNVLGNMMGGGSSGRSASTSQSSQVSPAPWGALYGNPSSFPSALSPGLGGGGFASAAIEKLISQGAGVSGPMGNLFDQIATDLYGSYLGGAGDYGEAKRDIMSDLLAAVSGLSTDYMADTGAATDQYLSTMSGLRQPAFDLSIGGQEFGVTPQRNAMLADMAANVMGAQTSQAQRGFDIGSALSQLQYQTDEAGIPLNMALAGIGELWPYIAQAQSWRFGLPSSETTQSASYNPSIWETIGNAVNTYQTISDLWNTMSPAFQTSQNYINMGTAPIHLGEYGNTAFGM